MNGQKGYHMLKGSARVCLAAAAAIALSVANYATAQRANDLQF